MRAAFYDVTGSAEAVLQVGDLPDPDAGPGEVVVRIALSGVSPGDTKKRAGWTGGPMPYPRVVPHSDGVGVITAVGDGVDAARLGRRVWVHGAQSYRPSGTAAEYTAVPDEQAVELPAAVPDALGASLGIPGITGHRAVFADGPVTEQVVLVQGVLGAVAGFAAQLAVWGGATVIGTVRSTRDVEAVQLTGLAGVVALDRPDAASAIRTLAPAGVDRVVEVAFSANLTLDAEVLVNGGVIAAYGTRDPRPEVDFWPLLFANTTIRLLGSDDFPVDARRSATRDLTAASAAGAIAVPGHDLLPLDRIAEAHNRIDAGARTRQLIDLRA